MEGRPNRRDKAVFNYQIFRTISVDEVFIARIEKKSDTGEKNFKIKGRGLQTKRAWRELTRKSTSQL